MSWLNKNHPLIFFQPSDIPYIVLEHGALLCFDNYYSIDKNYPSEFGISFHSQKDEFSKKNTHYFSFKQFPVSIPFEQIVSVNGTTAENIDKSEVEHYEDNKDIALIFAKKIKPKKINHIVDKYEQSFILVSEDWGHNLETNNEYEILQHSTDNINRNIITICHMLCPLKKRNCFWTKSIPDITVNCYGIEDQAEYDSIQNVLEIIGVKNFDIIWEN